MKRIVYALILLLVILHQDLWWWDDSDTLVLGFVPIGLGYHAAVSVAAAVLWALAVKFCWPADVDATDEPAAGGGGA